MKTEVDCMKDMNKTDEFDFELAQSILKSNSKKKSGKYDAESEQDTSLKLDTVHSTRDTKKKNWAQGESNS